MDSSTSLRLQSVITNVYRDSTCEKVIYRSPSAPRGSIGPSASVYSVFPIGTMCAVRRCGDRDILPR